MTEIIEAISNVGFPVALCVALIYYLKQLNDSHAEETKEYTTAINNLAAKIEKLIDKMGGE